MSQKGEVIDPVTVTAQLRHDELLEKAGNISYIAELTDLSPSAINTINYAKIVKEKAVLRKLILEFKRLMGEALNNPDNLDDFIDNIENKIFSITERRNFETFKSLTVSIDELMDTIQERFDKKEDDDTIKTGFTDLDKIIIGLQPANLIVLAARPGKGKTSLALNIAQEVAKNGLPVLFFSLEMSEQQLAYRLISSTAEINLEKLISGYISEDDMGQIYGEALTKLDQISDRIYIDTASTSLVEIKGNAIRKMKELKAERGLIIIDYLQLIKASRRFDRKDLEIGEISRSLKILSKNLDSPILVLSQLNREVDKRDDPKPRLSDLRESGAIEQDADVILFLYDPKERKKPNSQGNGEEETQDFDDFREDPTIIVEVAKNRMGRLGKAELIFDKKYTKFKNKYPY